MKKMNMDKNNEYVKRKCAWKCEKIYERSV